MVRAKAIVAAVMLTAITGLGGCVAPAGPIEVTRFHRAERLAELGHGPITLVAGPDMDPASIEYRGFAAAVSRELERIGYDPVSLADTPNAQHAASTAIVRYDRETLVNPDRRGPVSVGVGGSTGSYGSGVGLGIGFNLGGKPKDAVQTRLSVRIDDANGVALWEGRAESRARGGSPLADTSLAAAKLAQSLFLDFPGQSGETIEVE